MESWVGQAMTNAIINYRDFKEHNNCSAEIVINSRSMSILGVIIQTI